MFHQLCSTFLVPIPCLFTLLQCHQLFGQLLASIKQSKQSQQTTLEQYTDSKRIKISFDASASSATSGQASSSVPCTSSTVSATTTTTISTVSAPPSEITTT